MLVHPSAGERPMSSAEPPRDLHAALMSGDLVLVAGPGVDRSVGLPSMVQLARSIAERVRQQDHSPLEPADFERMLARGPAHAFEQLEYVLGLEAFRRNVADGLSCPYQLSPLVDAIAALRDRLRAVYTTSLVDGLFNRAFRGRWPSHDDPRPSLAQKKRLIFHLRGTLGRPRTWVLTRKDERRWLRPELDRGRLLGTVYHAHHLLLVGFEVDDPLTHEVLRMLPSVSDAHAPEHFMIVDGPCPIDERRRFEAQGFRVLRDEPQALLGALNDEAHLPRAESRAPSPTGKCPYPGLESFRESQAGLFFGRHVEVSQAASRLGQTEGEEARRWLTIEGPSGVGKSSFVHAGVVPALRNGFASGTPKRWTVATMRPGAQPVRNLVEALVDALDIELEGPAELEGLVQRVRHEPDSLRELLTHHTPPGHALLLVIDQLEEAATLGQDVERASFGLAVAGALSHPALYLVTTTRSDFIPALQEKLPQLASLLNERAERHALLAISRVGLREAIVEPAAREGVTIEPELVERILSDAEPARPHEDAEGEARSSASALPLVAHVLRALWDSGAGRRRKLTLDAYRELGGVRGALSQSAEEVVASLDQEETTAVERLLLGLVRVQIDGGQSARALDRAEAIERAGGSERGTRLLLRLSGSGTHARLLVVRREGTRERVELVHEALMRDWDRYRRLIDRNRQQLLLDDELERRADRWDEAGRPNGARELPDGRILAQLLEGRPRGERAVTQRDYQTALTDARHQRTRARRRLRRVLGAAGAAILAVAVGSAVIFRQQNQDLRDQKRQLDERNEDLARNEVRLQDEANAQKGLRASMLARDHIEVESVLLAIESLAAYGPDSGRIPPPEVYAGVLDVLSMTEVFGKVRQLEGHSESIGAIEFSPDGRRIAAVGRGGIVCVWEVESGRLSMTFVPEYDIQLARFQFSPDGQRLMVAGNNGIVRLYDAESGEHEATLVTSGVIVHRRNERVLEFSPNGNFLAMPDIEGGAAVVWDIESGKKIAHFPARGRPWLPGEARRSAYVASLAFSENGEEIAVGDMASQVGLWSVNSGRLLSEFSVDASPAEWIVFSPEAEFFVVCTYTGLQIVDAESGKATFSADHRMGLAGGRFSPDGAVMALWDRGAFAQLIDAESGREISTVEVDSHSLLSAFQFFPDGRRVVSRTRSGTKVMDVRSGREIARLHEVSKALAVSPDGRYIASSSANAVDLWSVERFDDMLAAIDAPLSEEGDDGNEFMGYSPEGSHLAYRLEYYNVEIRRPGINDVERRLEFDSLVTDLVWSRDGCRIAVVTAKSSKGDRRGNTYAVRIIDVASGRELSRSEGHSHISTLVLSEHGNYVGVVNSRAPAKVWAVATDLWTPVDGHSSGSTALAFSTNETTLVTVDGDQKPRVWDVASGRALGTLDLEARRRGPLAFTPNGALLIVGEDSIARLWDLESNTEQFRFEATLTQGNPLAFSPDGAWMVYGSFDSTVRVLHLESGLELIAFDDHADRVQAVAFSPDGDFFFSTSEDATFIHPMPHKALELACRRVRGFFAYPRVSEICGPRLE